MFGGLFIHLVAYGSALFGSPQRVYLPKLSDYIGSSVLASLRFLSALSLYRHYSL